jgi:hypothetical protein
VSKGHELLSHCHGDMFFSWTSYNIGADTVIFLEHDFNPFADLQGMQQLRDMEIFA